MDFTKHTTRIVDRLGELLLYSHAGGGAVTVLGVMSTIPQDVLGVEMFVPTVVCSIDDVPLIKHGDTFQRSSDTYKVIAKDVDQVAGTVKARLEKQ